MTRKKREKRKKPLTARQRAERSMRIVERAAKRERAKKAKEATISASVEYAQQRLSELQACPVPKPSKCRHVGNGVPWVTNFGTHAFLCTKCRCLYVPEP